jgi:hypothetical protein
MAAELLQKIHDSCEKKSHARTLDKMHPGAKVAARSRFGENDPHRLRADSDPDKVWDRRSGHPCPPFLFWRQSLFVSLGPQLLCCDLMVLGHKAFG